MKSLGIEVIEKQDFHQIILEAVESEFICNLPIFLFDNIRSSLLTRMDV